MSQNLGFGLKCWDGPYFKCCLTNHCFNSLPLSHPPSITTYHIRVQHGSRQSIKVSKCLAESSCPLTTLLELSRKTERKINCHVSWLSYSVSLSLFHVCTSLSLASLHISIYKSFSSPFLCICLLQSKERSS